MPAVRRPKKVGELLQSVNMVGISSYVSLVSMYVSLKLSRRGRGAARASGKSLSLGQEATGLEASIPILPSMETPDIRNIDWEYLYEHQNIRGVMFDKDHTLTLPYASSLHPYAAASLEEAKRVFGARNVVLYSNSAGLRQYDPDGAEARLLEERLGVHVLRHGYKKPFVSEEVRREVEEWFGVGDGWGSIHDGCGVWKSFGYDDGAGQAVRGGAGREGAGREGAAAHRSAECARESPAGGGAVAGLPGNALILVITLWMIKIVTSGSL